jgi:hypothetical protein
MSSTLDSQPKAPAKTNTDIVKAFNFLENDGRNPFKKQDKLAAGEDAHSTHSPVSSNRKL